MKTTTQIKRGKWMLAFKTVVLAIVLLTLGKSSDLSAQANSKPSADTTTQRKTDTIIESKVDYIEKIYFSGQNKEGLNNLILSTVQSLEGQKSSMAVAVQYIFLSGIKDKAAAADKSCDVEDLLAAGIYNIDINEALKQGISKPSSKVSGLVSGAISSAANISSTTNNAAWSTYVLTGGKVNTLGIGGVTSTLGGAANTAAQGQELIKQGKIVLKTFGLIKDKPCKDVQPKDIQIGEHPVPKNG